MPTPTTPARTTPVGAEPGRRRFIRLLGGGAVVAIAAPAAGCAAGVPEAATQPWRTAAQETDLRRWMLAHALLYFDRDGLREVNYRVTSHFQTLARFFRDPDAMIAEALAENDSPVSDDH